MPGQAPFILKWSSLRQGYELFEGESGPPLTLLVERLEEFSGLDELTSFAFVGQGGTYTARKETRQRGGGYWYAYRKQAGKLTKKYLGKENELLLVRLEQVAQLLAAENREQASASPAAAFSPKSPAHTTEYFLVGYPTPQAEPPISLTQETYPPDPLLATKLHQPHPRPYLVHRTPLIERLTQATAGTLTVVSAPAGFGKTTLLADWLSSATIPVAWLSLDAEDDEPVRFFTYFVTALQTLAPSIGAATLSLLHMSQPLQLQTALVVLANELVTNAVPDFVLVLDDYHFINSETIHQALGFLLEHFPVQMHLVIVTRADPPLPIARLRARGQLTEIRAADLRFANQEAQSFLQTTMKLELASDEVEVLQQRTEGWVAGLQFAALSLRGRSDTADFLQTFSGSHRFVLDYLSEEVFLQQSLAVQNFLLHTCILERLSGPLCDALTGQEGGQAMLENLERANMFVTPLDEERQWYRYHHLFADMLQSRLKQSHSALIPVLHRRASVWYEEHDIVIEAVRHAFAIPDVERVAQLIEQAERNQGLLTQFNLLFGWLNALPETLVRTRPLLCIVHARLFQVHQAQPKVIEARLRDAEQALERHPEDSALVLSGVIFYRAALALYRGDVPGCIKLSRQLLVDESEEGKSWYLHTLILTSRDFLINGDVTASAQQPIQKMVQLTRSVNSYTRSSAIYLWARFQTMQGRLREAVYTYQSFVEKIGQRELRAIVGGPAYFFGLGNIYREWNELDRAEPLLLEGLEIVRNSWAISADVLTLGYIALAELYRARSDYRQAHALLDEFLQLAHQREFVPQLVAWGRAAQVRLELSQGHLATANHWAENNSLSEILEPDYQREPEYLTLVRVRIAQGRESVTGSFLNEALTILKRLQEDAEAKARWHSLLEILILHSLTLEAQQVIPEALMTLGRAVKLAEAQGYIRLFIDEGQPMLRMLRQLHAQKSQFQAYLSKLIEAGSGLHELKDWSENLSSDQTPFVRLPQPLLEPLSERELEILRLIAAGVSNAAIAEQLVIALSTVKRHVSNILAKLEVSNRTQAVAQARSLGLL